MPGENIYDWSTTALTNGSADSSISFPEGQTRASLNNSCRSVMAAVAKHRNLTNGSIVTGGSANAQTFSSGLTYTSVPTGIRVKLLIGPGLTNTGSASLNMDGIGAVNIIAASGASLVGGELIGSTYNEFLFNGGNWILEDLIPPSRILPTSFLIAVSRAGAQTPASATWTKVSLTTETLDTESAFDSVTNYRWTPLKSGVYLVQAELSINVDDNTYGGIAIYKNGVPLLRNVPLFRAGTNPTSIVLPITAFSSMNGSTDYLELFGFSGSVGTPSFLAGALMHGLRIH